MATSRREREDLLWRFGKSDDPEVEARRQRILEVLLEASPQTRQKLIEQSSQRAFEEGMLLEARDALRRVLALRQLALSVDDDARIEACSDLATLEGWLDQAVTATSAAEALR